jgi:hypothetical protein
VGHVTPPRQDIRVGQDFLGEAVFRIIKGSGADHDGGAQVFLDALLHGAVNALRVELCHLLVFLLMPVFVPDGDPDRGSASHCFSYGF